MIIPLRRGGTPRRLTNECIWQERGSKEKPSGSGERRASPIGSDHPLTVIAASISISLALMILPVPVGPSLSIITT